jgi:hypothetical protein
VRRGLIAVVLAVGIGALGWSVQRGDAARRSDEAAQRDRQRRDVGLVRPVVTPPETPPKRAQCVQGTDGFATAVERQHPLVTGAKRLASFLRVSDLAIQAERRAELLRPAPTLPRRLGVENKQPVEPARLACNGKGFAEL